MILRATLTNVFNISKHTENYNYDEDEEKDTEISIIIYRKALTCLNKLKYNLMASSIDTQSSLNYLLK